VNASDCVLSIGGDLYTFAENEKNWMFPYPIMEAGNRVMRQGRPYVVWCASVGPLEKAGGRLDELRSHLEACRAIIVREQETYSYLRETLGIHENVYLGADPAFVMNPEPFACRFLEQKPGGTVLAVNFSLAPLQHVYGDLPVRELQATLARHVRAILDSLDVRVMFVPHVQGDYGFLSAVLQSLGGAYSDRLYILPEGVGAQRTKWAVSRARALLTMRFHCSLAGFSTNTPTMILVSTPKGAKICKEMYGDLEHALHIREMTEETLVCGVRKLLDDAEGIRARLAPASEKMARRAFACGEMLAHVLADNLPIGWNCPPEVPHPDLTSCSARWSLTEGRSA
jgi:polysaccharide pyruvyl transferase WcaK-like protein